MELVPESAPAHAMAAYCYVQRKSYGWFVDRQHEAVEATLLARRAAELAKDDAVALSKSAHAIASVGGDIDSGAVFIDYGAAIGSERCIADSCFWRLIAFFAQMGLG